MGKVEKFTLNVVNCPIYGGNIYVSRCYRCEYFNEEGKNFIDCKKSLEGV